MKNLALVTGLLGTSLIWQASAAIRIDVIPTLAPNRGVSPSWDVWAANELYAIENGLSSYGNPNLPSYFSVAPSTLPAAYNVVSDFPSWLGRADPGSAFGAAFASETGNRLHWAIHILGQGQRFSASQLSFLMDTPTIADPNYNLAGIVAPGIFPYNTEYAGIDYGLDRVKGTADDVRITSSLNTQLIDEYVGRGPGNAWWARNSTPGANDQARLLSVANGAVTAGGGPVPFSAQYTLGALSAGATITFVPEPSTWVLLGSGLLMLGAVRRRWANT
jgi:hypothetical protein